ncbi:MAG: hypothetical protein KatS3mg129_1530 [Leptospiraceae bacterium]|nr:MAG: hypothetical protein KatS3mg129_1530 [Leptospiraceae bacterium]
MMRKKKLINKKNIITTLLSLIVIILMISCKGQKDFLNPFQDKIEPKDGLFNLLDDYPALKSLFTNVNPSDFNYKLGESLGFYPDSSVGGMRSLQILTLNPEAKLRELLLEVAGLLQRIRTYDPNSYNKVMNLLQRIREHPDPFLENILPITHNGLKKLYLENTKESLKADALDLVNTLKDPDTKADLQELEDLLDKIIRKNNDTRLATEQLLQSLLIFDTTDTKNLSKTLSELLYNLGNILGTKVGYSKKSSDRVIKELIVNLENYTTPKSGTESNNLYDDTPAYQDISYGGYPSKADSLLKELFKKVKTLVLPDNTKVKDPSKDILDETAKTLANLGFTIEGADQSLLDLLRLDFKGRNRTTDPNTTYSGRFSALEALAYMVALGKHFGYNWNDNCPSTSSPVYITGESGGYLTFGDSLTAMRSKNDCTDLGAATIIKQANTLGETYKDGDVLKYDLNTPALCLLEGESKGDINCIDYNGDKKIDPDPIYAKTLPWVFGWLVKVLYEGYGPFYYDTPTTFNDTWTTSDYKIKVRNGDFAGLGGIQNPSGNGSHYTIKEIPITNRQVSSKEEAFFKNLLWLLYYKRFVIVIPLQANLGAGVLGSSAVKDAVYVTIIANGLKGLMNVKPYCSSSSSQCAKEDNGKWILSGKKIKTYNQIGDLDQSSNAWSSEPGDAVMLVEVWGCDIVSTCNYGFSGDDSGAGEILYQTVYNSVLFPKNAGDFYGAIPPALSRLFPVMERLAFLTSDQVTIDNMANYWNKRNRLTPVLSSLIKVLKDQTQSINDGNPANDINAYNLMVDLLIPLIKNYLFVGNDPYQASLGYPNASITLFRTLGYRADSTTSIRNPELQEEYYYPDAEYVFGSTRVGYRSIISILTENQSRYYDGLLPMIAQSHLLDEVIQVLQELGQPKYDNNRQKFTSSLKTFLSEMKFNSESPAPEEFNIEQTIDELVQKIADYPDTRSLDLSSSDWKDITDFMELGWKLLAKNSEYSISPKIEYLIEIINDVDVQTDEITALLNILNAIQVNDDLTPSYRLTKLATDYLPPLLTSTATYTKDLIGIAAGISKPGAFGDYFMTTMKSSYHVKDVLYDLERLLTSNKIQSYGPSDESILYQTGTLIKYLADIKEQGKKTGVAGYTFEDKWNKTEVPDSYFDRLSLILSSSKQ